MRRAPLRGGSDSMDHRPITNKLLCVALVTSLMVPAGRAAFPLIAGTMGHLPFNAAEAVLSAALGSGLYAALFG